MCSLAYRPAALDHSGHWNVNAQYCAETRCRFQPTLATKRLHPFLHALKANAFRYTDIKPAPVISNG